MKSINELTWKDILGYHKPTVEELEEFVKKGFHIISCDASYRSGVGTCSIQIRNGGRENTIKNNSFTAIGPNEAEIKAILYGIREAQNCKAIKKALFTNDNLQAVSFVTGQYTPKQENIKKALDKVKAELSRLNFSYEFALVRSKVNRKVDNSAKKHLTKREAVVEANIQKRMKDVQKNQEKSRGLECKTGEDNLFLVKSSKSDEWYAVDFKSMSCTCPYWKNNWGNKNSGAIFTRALPCKHMCGAAVFGGLDIFEIFATQIQRRK